MAPTPPETKVHISRTEESSIDREFKSIRERFDEEMKKMEEDMNRFRLRMQEKEKDTTISKQSTSSSSSSSYTKQTSSSRTGLSGSPIGGLSATRPMSPPLSSHQQQQRPGSRQGIADMTSWMDDFDSPLIKSQSDGDGKVLKLKFDVTQYEPEEIIVKTVDNKLQVHAKHEEKSDSRSVYREYNREFLLPEGVNPELIRSTLSRDGVLTVEAPLPQSLRDKARHIPIQKDNGT